MWTNENNFVWNPALLTLVNHQPASSGAFWDAFLTLLSLFYCICVHCKIIYNHISAALSVINTDMLFILHVYITIYTDILCCFSNFTCKYSRNRLSLSYVYLISSDDGSIIRTFLQINVLEGSWLYSLNGSRFSHYLINSIVWQQKQ